jgi:hypothetical protein
MQFLSTNPYKYKQKRRPVFPTGRLLKDSYYVYNSKLTPPAGFIPQDATNQTNCFG